MAATTGLMYPPIRAVTVGAVALIQFCPPPGFDGQFLPAAREETGAVSSSWRGDAAPIHEVILHRRAPRRLPVPAR
jgi:hypothetical protein